MIYTLEELREKITPIAEKYRIPAVYVFGSYARGEATEDSDVDVLFERRGSDVRGWIIGGLYNDLNEALGKEISLLTAESLEEPDQRLPRFTSNIMKDRWPIYEKRGSTTN